MSHLCCSDFQLRVSGIDTSALLLNFPPEVHTYGTLLESDLTYTPLRPDQMENSGLDMSLDEDTSSMDEIAQKCPLKPQRKTKGNNRLPPPTLLEISASPLIR